MIKTLEGTDIYILCGGLGKRLRKVSGGAPKPLVKVGDKPVLDIIISHLMKFGARRFVLGIGYKADAIRKYYREKKIPGCEVVFSAEDLPLGTGGAVKKARRYIKSRSFFVLNGDSVCKFDPIELLNFHKEKKAAISILLRKMACGKDYGEIKMDRARRILSFAEKKEGAKNCLINAGVYVFDKRVFRSMPRSAEFSLEHDFFPMVINKGIFGYPFAGYFIDIGTPQRHAEAHKDFTR